MTANLDLDATVARINAYTGSEVPSGAFVARRAPWVVPPPDIAVRQTLAPAMVDEADWHDPRVGWGVILPEPPALAGNAAALAKADDAPEPIRALVADRGGKVLRYRAGGAFDTWTLRDYAAGGESFVAGSPRGMGPKQLPSYLLIYGAPDQIPWQLQYHLNPVRRVGRLDLTDTALDNYVSHLMSDWQGSAARYDSPVVWSVDHGGGDITTLMRQSVAAPVADAYRTDKDGDLTGLRYVDGSVEDATGAALAGALAAGTPAIVVTTSHGLTGPVDDAAAMREALGLPVDAARQAVTPDALLGSWQPDGAVWYAHACCSAGSDAPSTYAGLFDPASSLDETLRAVASLGPRVSPLPRALLGASKPLRAFVGQVEPTFNWTLAFPPNQAPLTDGVRAALYDGLCGGRPIGLAFAEWYDAIGSLLQEHRAAMSAANKQIGAAATRTLDLGAYNRVTAYDRASTVILGDPTVAIPLPRRAP